MQPALSLPSARIARLLTCLPHATMPQRLAQPQSSQAAAAAAPGLPAQLAGGALDMAPLEDAAAAAAAPGPAPAPSRNRTALTGERRGGGTRESKGE